MKKNRSRLIKLFAIILFASCLFFLKEKIINFLYPTKIVKPFASINIPAIKEINFVNDGKSIIVYKKNNHWYQKKNETEFLADEERINKVIVNLISLVKDEIVSQNKNRHQDLGIGKNSLTIKTTNNKYALYIGQLSGSDKNYVRVGEENDVFVASGYTDIFTPFDYRDLNVNFVKNETKVSSFEISYNGNLVISENKKDKWFIGTNEAKKDRIDFFLNDLKTLKATDILPKKTPLSYLSELTIKVKENNITSSAEFYLNDKSSYYLKTSASDLIFQIPTAYVSSLKKEEKDFTE